MLCNVMAKASYEGYVDYLLLVHRLPVVGDGRDVSQSQRTHNRHKEFGKYSGPFLLSHYTRIIWANSHLPTIQIEHSWIHQPTTKQPWRALSSSMEKTNVLFAIFSFCTGAHVYSIMRSGRAEDGIVHEANTKGCPCIHCTITAAGYLFCTGHWPHVSNIKFSDKLSMSFRAKAGREDRVLRQIENVVSYRNGFQLQHQWIYFGMSDD